MFVGDVRLGFGRIHRHHPLDGVERTEVAGFAAHHAPTWLGGDHRSTFTPLWSHSGLAVAHPVFKVDLMHSIEEVFVGQIHVLGRQRPQRMAKQGGPVESRGRMIVGEVRPDWESGAIRRGSDAISWRWFREGHAQVIGVLGERLKRCLLYTSPSPRDS